MIQGGLIGRLNKRFGEAGLVRQGFVTLAVGLAAIPFATRLPFLILALVIATYGFSVVQPALSSLLTLGIPSGSVGGLIGIGRSAQTLARAGGPVFAGFIFETFGKNWPFLSSAAILVVVLVLSSRLIRRPQAS
jgi:MFS family permease